MKAMLAKTEERIKTPENKQEGVLSWDIDNNYPQRMRNIVADSVTGTSCLRIYAKFIIGNGATDLDFYKAPVNRKGLKVDGLIRKIAEDKAFIGAFAVHVNYNGAYEKVEVNPVRIDDVRITIDKGHAAIHPDWAKLIKGPKKFNKKDIQLINWYNPDPLVIDQQVAAAGGWDHYKGQIFYWSPFGLDYSIAVYDPSAEDMKTEGQLKLFRYRSAAQNFLASHAIVVNASEQNDEDATEGGDSGSHAETVRDVVQEFQGADNTGAVMIIEKENPDDTFEIQKLELQSYDGMYSDTRSSAKESIIESFLMPKPLLLEGSASIGESKEVRDAKEFYNDVTADDRLVLEEALREIFTGWEFKICPSDDYSIQPIKINKEVPPEYFPYYTANEIRTSRGDSEADTQAGGTKLLVEIIGAGGTQALTAILTDPILNEAQKKGALQVLFGLSEIDANTLLGIRA